MEILNKAQRLLQILETNPVPTPGLILPEAAGILLKHKNEGLFLKRTQNEDWDNVGSWAYTGGGINDGESPYQAALRECNEEIGCLPKFELLGEFQHGSFVTYVGEVANKDFEVKLNHEHEMYGWYNFSDQSLSPLHPGVFPVLQHFGLV